MYDDFNFITSRMRLNVWKESSVIHSVGVRSRINDQLWDGWGLGNFILIRVLFPLHFAIWYDKKKKTEQHGLPISTYKVGIRVLEKNISLLARQLAGPGLLTFCTLCKVKPLHLLLVTFQHSFLDYTCGFLLHILYTQFSLCIEVLLVVIKRSGTSINKTAAGGDCVPW